MQSLNSQGRTFIDSQSAVWLLPLLVFAILALANVVATLMVWHYSGGDRGWWPVHLAVFLAASCAYSLLFSALVRGTALASVRYATLYTLVLAFALNISAFLFYSTHIDWLAVDARQAQLTPTQRIIRSDSTPWSIYGVFIVGVVLFRARPRSRTGAQQG